jgi:hypothetical protein
VRLYWPDGSDGVNGTNDWQEDQSQISLQVARWYPSGMIMANGSILIVGGEIGQNDIEQPTLEILPVSKRSSLSVVAIRSDVLHMIMNTN